MVETTLSNDMMKNDSSSLFITISYNFGLYMYFHLHAKKILTRPWKRQRTKISLCNIVFYLFQTFTIQKILINFILKSIRHSKELIWSPLLSGDVQIGTT